MARTKLTTGRVREFTCPPDKSQVFLWDSEVPGLAVRATAGARAFVFQANLHGKALRVTLGDVRAWTLDDARTDARRLQMLVDQGTDPREEKRERIAAVHAKAAAAEAANREAEERQRYTLSALCDAYVSHLDAKGKARSAGSTRSTFKCHVTEAHPTLANLPARDVTPHQIAAIVRKVRESGKERTAGILRSYLSAAFNAAKRAPFDSAMPSDLIAFRVEHNPVDAIPAIAVKAGNRTLSAPELRAYIGNLLRVGRADAAGDNVAEQALRLALLAGGQRMAQLLRAKVSDYNPDTATLRLWDGKGKRISAREHLLPLGAKAAALTTGLVERAKEKKSDLLFSTHGRVPMAMETPGKRATEIAAAMEGEPFNLRDIRRTCETMLAGMGISRDVRAQLLSHGISGVQAAHYDRHSYTDEKRAALVAWEAKLDAIEKNEQAPSNVVRLRSREAT